MEGPFRVRMVFDDRKMLSKSQRSEGLKRCWLLLSPEIATISDLESHVHRAFDLKRSCPNGLVLSMDDFVLPPFESASILKDSDIIRVRKKDAIRMDAINLGDDPHYIQDSGVLEKQHTVSCDKFLAIKELGEDSCHKRKHDNDVSAHDETAICIGATSKSKNKRKLSDEIQGSKMKKLKTTEDEDIHLEKKLEYSQNMGSSPKSSKKKNKPSTEDERPGTASDLEDDIEHMTSSLQKKKRGKKSRFISPELAIVTIQGAENILIDQNPSSSKKKDGSAKRLHIKDTQSDDLKDQNPSSSKKIDGSAKRLHIKDKQSDEEGRSDAAVSSRPHGSVNEEPTSVLMEERNVQAKENIGGTTSKPHVPSRTARRKKAKRQWLKELKSQLRQNTQSQIQPNAVFSQSPEHQETGKNSQNQAVDVPSESQQQQEAEKGSEQVEEIVPVIIRPGHIRFRPLDDERTQLQSQEATEFLHWNGTTSKRKGQKWGQEKNSSNWNEANGFTEQYHGKAKNVGKWNNDNGYAGQQWAREKTVGKWNDYKGSKGQKWSGDKTLSKWNNAENYKEQCNGREKFVSKWNDANGEEQCNTKASSWGDANGYTEQSNREAVSEKGKTGSSHPNFESLFPLTRIPQVGDVLVYRLIELSSSWCPEVSSFRVGEVTSYNYLNMSIILVPVPEYPIFSDEEMERRDSMLQANSSPYNDDGSLQIHYPSLIDVRLLKAIDAEATPSDHPGGETNVQEAAPGNNRELAVVKNSNASGSGPEMSTQETLRVNNWEKSVANNTANENIAQPTENGNTSGSAWDQIKQALNEKKAQLQKKKDGWDEWTASKSAAGTSWSYTALRRSAVGPTLAYLRGKNVRGRPKK